MKQLSVIIPALNEASQISQTLQVIRDELGNGTFEYEVILVDNGSSDDTVSLAQQSGARTLVSPNVSIAALRNAGVAASNGSVLLFLDADVLLSPGWLQQLQTQAPLWTPDSYLVTGCRCQSPDPNHYLTRFWFGRMKDRNSHYINRGHLITNRATFTRIGGFDENLSTVEDADFCERAHRLNIPVRPDPKLVAIHRHYPESLSAFIGREIWHGRADVSSWDRFRHSAVALVATALVTLLVGGLVSTVLLQSAWPLLLALLMGGVGILAMTHYKFGAGSPAVTLGSAGLLTIYLLSRFSALFLPGQRVRRNGSDAAPWLNTR